MKPYAIMLQTDVDDKFITESILEEINSNVPVIFISHSSDIKSVIETMGHPTVILVNDSSRHTASEQLNGLKSDPSINHIPVVVLGEVVSDEYIRQYYRAGANTYIVKPSSIANTRLKIDTFFRYWFDVAEV
jgi:response regulator RpfG family c-di-GMP phosphodiesterase